MTKPCLDRDFIGYGPNPPNIKSISPHRILLNFVINYEEGAEANILDGDDHSEGYLTDIPQMPVLHQSRHLLSESLFEYGSRAGIWRLTSLFDRHAIPVTFFAVGLALSRNPVLCEYLAKSSHEIAGHGYRWINYHDVPIDVERQHIQMTCDIIKKNTGKEVVGWYTGRYSANTRELVVEQGLRYDSDSYSDDLPYWLNINNQPHLVIPYALDTNDARYAWAPGWSSGDDFCQYLCRCFDYLYAEGETCPKVMSVGLHPRLSGRPGRAAAIANFIQYTQQFSQVGYCRRSDIADLWYQHFKEK